MLKVEQVPLFAFALTRSRSVVSSSLERRVRVLDLHCQVGCWLNFHGPVAV